MLGRAAEGNDDPVEAVSAYVRALQKMPDTVAARQGLERLRQRCHSLPGFLLALPAGWRSEGHMVTDDARRHGVVVHTTAGGAVRSLAETLALRSIPMELFDEQELLHGDGEEPNDGERAAETGDGETHAHRWPRHRLRREAISKPLQGQLLQIDVFPGRTSDGEQLTGTVRRSVFAAAIGGKTVGLVLEGDADLSQARTLLLTLAARLIPTVEQDGKRR